MLSELFACAPQQAVLIASPRPPRPARLPPLRLAAEAPRPPAAGPPAEVVAALPAPPKVTPQPAPPPEHESRPEPIPLQVLAGAIEPLHADDPTLPDQVLLASRGKVLQGSYKLCIAADGKVQSVTPVVGIEGVDRCVVETLKTWQFPKLPVLLCKLQTLRFEIP